MTFDSQLQTYFSQLEANPFDLSIVTQMERLYGAQNQWGEMVETFCAKAEEASSSTYRARLLFESGRIAATHMDELALASTLLGLASESGQDTAVEYEARLFTLALGQQWDELQECFASAVEKVTQPEPQGVLYERLGEILVRVGQDQQADSMFSYARTLNEQSVNAVWAMQSLARANEAWEHLSELVYAELEMAEDATRQLELLLDLGDIYKDHLHNVEAAKQCYANALGIDPGNAKALGALEGLDQDAEPPSVAQASSEGQVQDGSEDEERGDGDASDALILEEIDENGVREMGLEPMALEPESLQQPPPPAPPAPPLEEPGEALEETVVGMPVMGQEASVLADQEETYEELPAVGEERAGGVLGEPTLNFAHAQGAEQGERGALEFVEPRYAVVQPELEALSLDAPDGDLPDGQGQEAAEQELSWQEQVMHHLGQVQGGGEAGEQALYTAALIEILNRPTETAPPAGELPLQIWSAAFDAGLGEVLWEEFYFRYVDQEFGGALLELAREKGASAELQGQIALGVLGDLELAKEIASGGEAPELVQLVEDVVEAKEDIRAYQRTVLEKRYSDLERGAERNAVMYAQMARIAQFYGDDAILLEALRRLDSQASKAQMQQLYAGEETKWPAYVDLLKRQMSALPESMVDAQVAMLLAAVEVYRNRIGNDLQAIAMYKQITELRPNSMSALDALIEIYKANNRASEQVSLLKRKVEIAPSRGQKVELLKELADLYATGLRNPGEALKAYENVLELAPQDEEAIAYLTETYKSRNKWAELIELRRRQLAGETDAAAQLAGLKAVAALATANVRNPEPAIELWRQAWARTPQDLEVLGPLESLYEKKRDYEELATVLEQQVGLIKDAGERMKIYQKLGMLLSERVKDAPSERIQMAWQGALALDPTDLRARKFLERLYIDTSQWDELERLYGQQHAYGDLVRVLETMAGTEIPQAQRIDLLVRSARLWRTRLGDLGRAERALERVQQIDPTHETAAVELAQIYATTENWPGVIAAYEVILGHQRELEDRRRWQLQLAQVYSAKLGDNESAFSWLAQIFMDDASRLADADKLEAIAATIDGWVSVLDLYEQALGAGGVEPELEVALRLRLGRVYADEMGDLEGALLQYNAILKAHEHHPEAMAALAGVYERQGRWDELMELYTKRLSLVEETGERVAILHGLARIAEHQAHDLDRAVATYLEAYELDPGEDKTLMELHRLYAHRQEHEKLADTMVKEITLIEDRAIRQPKAVDVATLVPLSSPRWDAAGVSAPSLGEISGALAPSSNPQPEGGLYREAELERVVRLYEELGFLYARELGEDAKALEAFGKVVVARPSDREVVEAIEPYLQRGGGLALAAALTLEPVYEIYGRWSDLIGTLRLQLGELEAEQVQAKVELLDRIATIYLDELGQAAESFQVYRELLGQDPSHIRARAQLHRLADALGQWEEFVQIHKEVAQALGEQEQVLKVEYLFTMARTLGQRLGHKAQAQQVYREIVAVEPRSFDALTELEELYIELEQWRELIWTYERRLEVTEEVARARDLCFSMASIHEHHLGQAPQAIEVLERALKHEPEHVDVLAELERLNREQGQWPRVAQLVTMQLEAAATAQEALGHKVRLGQVYEEHLEQVSRAISLYYEVFTQTDRQSEEAIGALERVMKNPAHDAVTAPVSDWLGELFTQTKQWERYAATLEAKARREEDLDQKIELLHQVAKLWETRIGQPLEAMEVYSRAFAADVSRTDSLDEITRLAQEHAAWDRVVQVLEHTAQASDEVSVKRDLWRRASRIYRDRLGDADATAARLEDVLAMLPQDEETMADLEQIYNQLGEWKKLVGVMLVKVDSLADGQEQKQLLKQAALTLEELADDPEQAIEVYYKVLEHDPRDHEALLRIDALATRLERWEELLENTRRRLELAEQDEERVRLLYVMGTLEQEALARPEDAIETYRRIVAIDPGAQEALERLDTLLVQTENWADLLDVLKQRRDQAGDEATRKELQFRIGQIKEQEDPLAAIEVYREVLSLDPAHAPTLGALAAMVERGEEEVEAAKVLRPLYEVNEQWPELVHVLELLIASTQEVDAKLEITGEMAQIQEKYMQEPGLAFYSWSQAMDWAPAQAHVLGELERLGRGLGAWDVLIDLLDVHMERVEDAADRAHMQLRVARIYEQELHDPGAAIDRYVRVLDADPLDANALAALDRLYQQEQHWEELTEVLGMRVEQALDPQERLELQLRQGMVYQEFLSGRAQDALRVYETVLLEDPGNPRVIAALEAMFRQNQATDEVVPILEAYYTERGERAKLIELYRGRLDFVVDGAARHKTFMLIAQLHEELGQGQEALGALSLALLEQPGDEVTANVLDRLAGEQGQWPLAAQAYFNVLEQVELKEEWALQVYLRLARVIDQEMQMPLEAEDAYKRALGYDPGQPVALAALDRIYTQHESWEALAEILERRIQETVQDDELIDLRLRASRVYQEHVHDLDRAVTHLQELLKIDPRHVPALGRLAQLYLTQGDWQELYEVLGAQVELTMDGQEQVQLLGQMATLAQEQLGKPEQAAELLKRVIDIEPSNLEAIRQLRGIYAAESNWEELVGLLEDEIRLTADPSQKLELQERLGIILGDHLDNEVKAMDVWLDALRIQPDHFPALEALRSIYARRQEHHELADILDRMIAHPDLDPERQKALWIEQADLQGEFLSNPDRAIKAWQQVAALDGESELALESLERLYLEEARWSEAVDVLDAKLGRAQSQEERLELAGRIATLLRDQVMDEPRAAQYYEYVLEIDPYHTHAYQALEEIYQAQESEESTSQLVNLYITHAAVVQNPEERLDALRRAATAFEERASQPESALVVLLSALDAQTMEDEVLIGQIESLAERTGMWAEVLEHYRELLTVIEHDTDQVTLHKLAGRICATKLEQLDDAVYHYQNALRLRPHSDDVLLNLERLYQRLSSWPELAQVLAARLEVVDDPVEKIELWRKLAEVQEVHLDEPRAAIQAYDKLLGIDEADLIALEAQERLYERLQEWDALIEVLRRKLGATFDRQEQVQIRYRIAQIHEQFLQDPEGAIDVYHEILEEEPTHLESLEALERLYTGLGKWEQALDIYIKQLGVLFDPATQIDIYGKMAFIHEENFGQLEEAIDDYRQILTIDAANETAIQQLERLYYTVERWDDLVEVAEQHIRLDTDATMRVQLLAELAKVHRQKREDPHSAVEVLERLLKVDPRHIDSLRDLGQLYQETGNLENAVEILGRLAQATPEVGEKIAVYAQMGEIFERQILDDSRAEHAYQAALNLQPDHDPVLEALQAIYERRPDWQAMIQVLKRADEASKNLQKKAYYTSQIGQIYEQHVGDPISALRYYEQAQELDPEVIASAQPLIDVYMREKRWERALPLLEKVLDRFAKDDQDHTPSEYHRRYLQMAQTCENLGLEDRAIENYHRAYEYDSSHLEGMLGLARALFRHQDYDAAFKVYQNIQLQHIERLSGEEAVEVFFHSGRIKQHLGEVTRATDYFEKTLDYDPTHREATDALLANYERAEKWDRVIDLTRHLLGHETERNERFLKLLRIGDIYNQKIVDPGMAVQVYLEALDIEPKSVSLLRKLLTIYQKIRQWPDAVEILKQLTDLEQSPARRASFHYTIGVIYRDEIGQPLEAVPYFEATMDQDLSLLLDPNIIKAFEAIDRILTEDSAQKTEANAWKPLERAYRNMLHRVDELLKRPEADRDAIVPLYVMLLSSLGEIYRNRMKDYKAAIMTYEIASNLAPGNEKLHLILAQLYELTGSSSAGVILQHRKLIEHEPLRIDSYHALYDAFYGQGEFDKAWCMARTLAFLQKATPEEQRMFAKVPQDTSIQRTRTAFNLETFGMVHHPSQDRLTTQIMALLYRGLAHGLARKHRELGLNPKKPGLSLEDQLPFCGVYKYVSSRLMPLGFATPQMFLQRNQAIGIRNANVLPAAVEVGADMLQAKSDKELAFWISKRLCWMMPDHYLGSLGYTTEMLRLFFMVALHVANPQLVPLASLSPDAPTLLGFIEDAAREEPTLIMNLQKLAGHFLKSGKNPNLSQWLIHAEHTTNRLGFLMCGDLGVAAECIKRDPVQISKASAREKIQELVLFSISEEYFALRQQLGFALQTK